jgi:hypothetical protein
MLIEICDAFKAHDLNRIMRFFADDCVLEMPKGSKPYGSRFEGKHNMREGLAARVEGLPDVHCGNAEHLWIRDLKPAFRNGASPAPVGVARRVEVYGCDFYTFRVGEVIRNDSYWKIAERN